MTHQLCKHAEYVERPRTHVDDDRTEDTNTTVGDVHEHGEEEVAVCPWVDEGLSDLIPLPLVVSDSLGVGLDSVDGDGLLSITQPAHTNVSSVSRVIVGMSRTHVNCESGRMNQYKTPVMNVRRPNCARKSARMFAAGV